MKQFHFNTGIYNADIQIHFIEDSFDYIEKEYELSDCSDFDAICFRNDVEDDYHIAFLIKHFSFSKLSHEIVHLVNMIFEDRLVELDLSNDEPQAYLHEYIFKKVENIVCNELKLYHKNVA